jgi:hypothetical protein
MSCPYGNGCSGSNTSANKAMHQAAQNRTVQSMPDEAYWAYLSRYFKEIPVEFTIQDGDAIFIKASRKHFFVGKPYDSVGQDETMLAPYINAHKDLYLVSIEVLKARAL